MGRLSENSVVSIKNKSFAVTADLEVPAKGAEGVMIAQGGRFGGWSLYAKGGKAKFVYNVLGIKSYDVEATRPIPAGKTQVRMEFAYDGGGLGKGGNVTLYCDGKEVGKGRVDQTQGFVFSADETTDIGYESGTTRQPRLHRAHQPIQRQDQLGADRPGQGRPGRRPLHLAGGAAAHRDGAAVDRRYSGAAHPHRTRSGDSSFDDPSFGRVKRWGHKGAGPMPAPCAWIEVDWRSERQRAVGAAPPRPAGAAAPDRRPAAAATPACRRGARPTG